MRQASESSPIDRFYWKTSLVLSRTDKNLGWLIFLRTKNDESWLEIKRNIFLFCCFFVIFLYALNVSYSLLDIAALYWIYLVFNFSILFLLRRKHKTKFFNVFWNLFYTPTALLFDNKTFFPPSLQRYLNDSFSLRQ